MRALTAADPPHAYISSPHTSSNHRLSPSTRTAKIPNHARRSRQVRTTRTPCPDSKSFVSLDRSLARCIRVKLKEHRQDTGCPRIDDIITSSFKRLSSTSTRTRSLSIRPWPNSRTKSRRIRDCTCYSAACCQRSAHLPLPS